MKNLKKIIIGLLIAALLTIGATGVSASGSDQPFSTFSVKDPGTGGSGG
jgi:hypothetical protein